MANNENGHEKRTLISLVATQMQIKITTKHHSHPLKWLKYEEMTTSNVGDNVEHWNIC